MGIERKGVRREKAERETREREKNYKESVSVEGLKVSFFFTFEKCLGNVISATRHTE